MKLELTEEQIALLFKEKKSDVKYSKELTDVKKKLTEALDIVNALLAAEPVTEKKSLTDAEWIALFKSDKSNVAIAKETGYNSAYVGTKKKKLMK